LEYRATKSLDLLKGKKWQKGGFEPTVGV